MPFRAKIVTMMIAPPGIDWSGPVIAGWRALATSRTRARSNRVNWPTSRLPKMRRAATKSR